MGKSNQEKAGDLVEEAVAIMSDKPKKSVNLLDKAIKLYPTAGIYYYRGLAYDKLNKGKKANQDYQQALDLAGSNVHPTQLAFALDAANNYGSNLQGDKKWADLIKVSSQAIQLCETYTDYFPDEAHQIVSHARKQLVFLGKANYEKKNWEQSYVSYLRAKKLGEMGALGNMDPETDTRIIELENKLANKSGIDWGKIATEGISAIISNI